MSAAEGIHRVRGAPAGRAEPWQGLWPPDGTMQHGWWLGVYLESSTHSMAHACTTQHCHLAAVCRNNCSVHGTAGWHSFGWVSARSPLRAGMTQRNHRAARPCRFGAGRPGDVHSNQQPYQLLSLQALVGQQIRGTKGTAVGCSPRHHPSTRNRLLVAQAQWDGDAAQEEHGHENTNPVAGSAAARPMPLQKPPLARLPCADAALVGHARVCASLQLLVLSTDCSGVHTRSTSKPHVCPAQRLSCCACCSAVATNYTMRVAARGVMDGQNSCLGELGWAVQFRMPRRHAASKLKGWAVHGPAGDWLRAAAAPWPCCSARRPCRSS
jgi:hypothetical protein